MTAPAETPTGIPVDAAAAGHRAVPAAAASVLTFLAAGAATTAVANRGPARPRCSTQIGPMRTAADRSDRRSAQTRRRPSGATSLNGSLADLSPYQPASATLRSQTAAHLRTAPPPPRRSGSSSTEITPPSRTGGPRWPIRPSPPCSEATGTAPRPSSTTAPGSSFDQSEPPLVTACSSPCRVVRDEAVTTIKDTSTTLLFVLDRRGDPGDRGRRRPGASRCSAW